jgi:hypothetical protein
VKQLGVHGTALADHGADLAIEDVGVQALAERSAEEVLLVERGEHQRRRDRARVVDEVHVIGREVLIGLRANPGADGDDEHLLLPGRQRRWYGSTVAIRKTKKAGLLYIVTPPSTIRKAPGPPAWIASGGKYVGAAVLARTSCQRGRSRLQASPSRRRSSRLYLA